ncbi:MAG: Rieske 2Fe-2S domain-containing protein [Actinomycetota bacterium]
MDTSAPVTRPTSGTGTGPHPNPDTDPGAAPNTESDSTTVTRAVGDVADWEIGSMRMRDVDGHKIAVVRTESGFHAVDNACPHQGYGLTTGSLDGELLTCLWHNWKFDVTTGNCVRGEEAVACHQTDVVDGEVHVTVTSPTDEEKQQKLWPSLRQGITSDYVGQISRDSVRLLQTGAAPGDIMWAGIEETAPKTDYGIGHELAMAADCLALAEVRHGTDRALPLVQGLAGMSETTRDRPVRETPDPDESIVVSHAIEREDADSAMAGTLASIISGDDPAVIRHQLIEAASAHHLSYGHGMIYTQKSFEVLDRVGWHRAPELLPHLAARLVWSTREDTLPYMKKAVRRLATVDLGALAETERADGWQPNDLVDTLLDATEAPIDAAVAAAATGAGIDGLFDAVSLASSRRLLRHDLAVELDLDDDFGWLDITHALTTAQAARWAWEIDPGPHTARAALFAVWLLFDSGRAERRRGRWDGARELTEDGPGGPGVTIGSETGIGAELTNAVITSDTDRAVELAMTGDPDEVGLALAEASLADTAGSFIVAAHLIKTTEAARRESATTGSALPLAAAARFLAAPRLERFVASNVAEAVEFVTTGRPPKR